MREFCTRVSQRRTRPLVHEGIAQPAEAWAENYRVQLMLPYRLALPAPVGLAHVSAILSMRLAAQIPFAEK